jgi:hypothetical protein
MYNKYSKELYNKKPSWIDKLKMKVSSHLKPKTKSAAPTKKPTETTRTKRVTKQLEKAGVTKSETKRLRGKR